EDNENLKVVYDPEHPDADEDGYVFMPNVNLVDEMIALLNTQRTYEANVTALNTSKSILKKALEISKD
ncbi:MAG TPA: flagellar basal body rod C-terminal domain-containing protein, partial [Tissierellaceae bacterium]|nr:flagellar basal body rod C-terminal domain-containing protein [Tissierellaceae bacterium]